MVPPNSLALGFLLLAVARASVTQLATVESLQCDKVLT